MRLRYLIFSTLLISLPAMGITFQDRIETAAWKVDGDQFECRMTQDIPRFGAGEFVRRAGEQTVFRLKTSESWLTQGSATLLAAATPWQPGRGDLSLGAVKIQGGSIPLHTSEAQGRRLLTGLLEGRSPVVRHRVGGNPFEVRVLPAKFDSAYKDFQLCATKLLPVNFDQVRHSLIGFPRGGSDLDTLARDKLDIIMQYLKADPTVNRVIISGYTDNSGDRLDNRQESRLRALSVMEYLKASGFPEEQMEIRFFGEQYPLVANTSKANRARNRRVSLVFSREPVAAPAPEAPVDAPSSEPITAAQSAKPAS
ncbi:OmpA family protein [Pseudomonas duriflava]|uniref:OmpA family protein n=1 Tax=Pseudomonas duriflava TaxID=459528 RepID=A0A562QBV0_9PSED|nr:OmpA family protein [Pseudomonas duriflava]TWI53506.1 OmpA family protein [Pseudomonas duriflava]